MKKKSTANVNEQDWNSQEFREETYADTIATERRHELLFAPYNVSFSVYRTLIYLWRHAEGAAPSEAADSLAILRQTMTKILDSMEKRGLVHRSADPNDRRRICVFLTESGKALAAELFEIEEEYTRRIHSHFTEEEGEMYRRLVRRLSQAKQQELEKILAEREAKTPSAKDRA